MTRLVRLVLVLAPGPLLASACPSVDPFACLGDEQCTLMADGVCHDNGACSYPDGECDSGHRWSQTAGVLADTCVEVEATSSGTTSSEPASTSSAETSSSGPLPQPECGNGVVEGDEECDEGEDADCSPCTSECHLAGQLRWSAVYDGMGFADYFDDVAIDENGDSIAVGRTSTAPAQSSKDRVVVRYDGAGEQLWAVSEPLPRRGDLNCVALSPAGEIIAAGVQVMDDDVERLWVGRYDETGEQELLAYGTPSMAQGCTFTDDGQLVVVGVIDGPDDVTTYERWDRLVLHDALGAATILDIEGIDALEGARDFAFTAAVAPAGELLVAGSVTTSADFASDRWLARFDAMGTWVDEYVQPGPGTGQEEILGLVFHEGKVFAAGSTLINDGNTEQTWFARLDFDGLLVDWQVSLPLPPAATIVDLALDSDGMPLVVIDVEGGRGLDDDGTAVAALDPETGACRWIVRDPGGMRRAGSLAIAPDGAIVVVGADAPSDAPATNALVASLSP